MSPLPDDPKYTAYVVGELSATDRTAIEAELKANPQLASHVAEIERVTRRLSQELANEPSPALVNARRDELFAIADKTPIERPATGRRRLTWALAITASLLLAVESGWLLRGMTAPHEDRLAASNSMKQIDLSLINTEDKRSAMSAAVGVVNESPVASVDASGSVPIPNDVQVRQWGFNGPTPHLGGFQANSTPGFKFDGRSQSGNKLEEVGAAVGGQGISNLAVGNTIAIDQPPYTGATTAQAKSDYLSTVSTPGERSDGTYYSISANGSGSSKTLSGPVVYSPGKPGEGMPASNFAAGTTPKGGTLSLSGASIWSDQKQAHYGHVTATPGLGYAGVGNDVTAGYIAKRIATLNSGTSPSEIKTALSTVLGAEHNVGINAALREGFARSAGPEHEFNTESYDPLIENPFLAVVDNPLSTFSIDVDTASYSNIRRFLLQQNQLPPAGAVRIEELINYFHYEYPQPEGERPFSVTTEVASCPWVAEHRLVRIGLKGREIPADKRPPTSLVFLIDVSGSMEQPNKLPLVQESLKLLTKQLTENDHVAIVVYAGNSGLVLPSTRGNKHEEIIAAIERLRAGGSTNGGQGIQLAYEIASQNFLKGGVNRVILATDGDFNVGITNQDELVRLIQEQAKTGVFLTTLGFGYGNLKDSTMQKLADKGNGNNYYIDDLPEARKVLVEQMGGTLVTIAKDVKIQIEFNPQEVAGYRLIGYEKRMLAKEDFNNDKIDAGEIGAGHTVTALYEVVPTEGRGAQDAGRSELAPGSAGGSGAASGAKSEFAAVDAFKYVKPAELTEAAKTGELFTLKLRYKQPDGEKSSLMETPVKDAGKKYGEASADFKFAAAVASFGMILRDSQFKGNATWAAVQELAGEGLQQHDDGKNGADDAKENDERARRTEFVQLIERAKTLKGP